MTSREVKLAIAVPSPGTSVPTQFFESFAAMQKPYGSVFLTLTDHRYWLQIDGVRNNFVEQAFKANCTHIAMLDADQVYPVDTIPRLFAHGKKIVRAKVHRRGPPFDPILLRADAAGRYQHIPDEEWMNGGLVEVDATGVACCGLFDMEVFENIPYPWFEIDKERRIGEDIVFCRKAIKAGYEIWVDCDLEVQHLIELGAGRTLYEFYKWKTEAETGNRQVRRKARKAGWR
ncbi:MAG TPA: hypothetical protein PK250_16155 [Syntrophobacter fumaroxidans]|nr:hypothetical protein [Syntrophobacter fumaroxidans]